MGLPIMIATKPDSSIPIIWSTSHKQATKFQYTKDPPYGGSKYGASFEALPCGGSNEVLATLF